MPHKEGKTYKSPTTGKPISGKTAHKRIVRKKKKK